MKNIDYEELLKSLIKIVVDSLEEFFEVLTVPTTSFTKDAFLVSLCFTAWSFLAHYLSLPAFVSWQEAVTTSVLLLIVVFIDSGARNQVKGGLVKLKEMTKSISERRNKLIEEEGVENGTTDYQRGSEFSNYGEENNPEIACEHQRNS